MKQSVLYRILGMQKDVADSAMDKQHAYDLHNIRMRGTDHNSYAAMVNELGNLKAFDGNGNRVRIRGTVIGFNTLNNTAILFTHDEDDIEYKPVVNPVEDIVVTGTALLRSLPTRANTDGPEYFCDYSVVPITPGVTVSDESPTTLEINGSFPAGTSVDIGINIDQFYGLDLVADTGNVLFITTDGGTKFVFGDTEYTEYAFDKSYLQRWKNLSFILRFTVPDEEVGTTVNGSVNIHMATGDSVPTENSDNQTAVDNTDDEQDHYAFPDIDVVFAIGVTEQVDPGSDPDEPEDPEVPPYIPQVSDDPYEEEASSFKGDHIYLVTVNKLAQPTVNGADAEVNIFEYFRGDLGFDTEHPIESTVYFENEKIQKVYWVDGIHQMRYANTAERRTELIGGTETEVPWTSNIMFDSVPKLHLAESVTVQRKSTGGVFPSCTVQWCFTYLNRYGAESNIAWISPIHYSSPDNRGGRPDEICGNSFTLTINGYENDGRFDYIRLYHIVHTTLDGEAEVRRVADIDIPEDSTHAIVYTDTNTTGEVVDPNELLYLGGISVTPSTLEQKSNTLFLGNLKQDFKYVRDILDAFNAEAATADKVGFGNDDGIGFVSAPTTVPADVRSGYYSHENQLKYDSYKITSFQRGERYRFGFQAQDSTGRWSDVWWLADKTNNDCYPHFDNGVLNVVHAKYTLNANAVNALRDAGYRKVRPVVVYPEVWERNIFTNGLLNPTVYNVKDRHSNAPFAQSSWFIRPFPPINFSELGGNLSDHFGNVVSSFVVSPGTENEVTYTNKVPFPVYESFFTYEGRTWESLFTDNIHHDNIGTYHITNYGTWPEFRHNHPLGDSQQRNGEVQSMYNPRNGFKVNSDLSKLYYDLTFPYINGTVAGMNEEIRQFVNNFADFFYVDQSILTMNSADIEFDEVLQAQDIKNFSLRIVGLVPITSFISSYDIRTNTPPNKFYKSGNNGMLMPQGFYASETIGAKAEDFEFGWRSLVNGALWHDDFAYCTVDNSYENEYHMPVGFAVYPWQGQGSLNNDSIGSRREYPKEDGDAESKSNVGDNYISAELKMKTFANLHHSWDTYHLTDLSYAKTIGTRSVIVLDQQDVALTKIDHPLHSTLGTLHYFGAVDKLVIPSISGNINSGDSNNTASALYPMSRNGGYPKMISYLPFNEPHGEYQGAGHTTFASPYTPISVCNTLTGYTHNSSETPHPLYSGRGIEFKQGADRSQAAIPIKYKSCNHIVLALDYTDDDGDVYQNYLPWYGVPTTGTPSTPIQYLTRKLRRGLSSTNRQYWNGDIVGEQWLTLFEQFSFNDCICSFPEGESPNYQEVMFEGKHCGFLYMGQLFRNESSVVNRFGGDSDEALEQNIWLPAGEAVYLIPDADDTDENKRVTLEWSAGDTYYQRYDALRTYPFTEEDINKVVDIVSFMTETHINIDGRYDRNRGLTDNTHCRPTNFNLLNHVYSQRDNFFTYHTMNTKKVHLDVFNYSFTWTTAKTAGGLRDEWTRITIASTYDCDGNKGQLTSITRLDNNLVAFQENGVAQILFNETSQVQATDGLPFELANSGKMQGLRYYTTEVGCQNKWSIAVFPDGIYWIDGRVRELYMLGGNGIIPISTPKMMSSWFKQRNDFDMPWVPSLLTDKQWHGILCNRDITTGELFITGKDMCLCYDTLAGEFTSFYDYGSTNAMFTIDGVVITSAEDRSFKGNMLFDNVRFNYLWLHRKNRTRYCRFYNENYPFHVEIVCNSNNEGSDYGMDKVFDNMSWRYDAWRYGIAGHYIYMPFTTFTGIDGSNRYQTFSEVFDTVNGGTDAQLSYPRKPVRLRKKFDIWHTTMPRAAGTTRDRIRDTWCHIMLSTNAATSGYRHIIHDLTVTYFIP